jgi:hypothetical protein
MENSILSIGLCSDYIEFPKMKINGTNIERYTGKLRFGDHNRLQLIENSKFACI